MPNPESSYNTRIIKKAGETLSEARQRTGYAKKGLPETRGQIFTLNDEQSAPQALLPVRRGVSAPKLIGAGGTIVAFVDGPFMVTSLAEGNYKNFAIEARNFLWIYGHWFNNRFFSNKKN